MANPKKKKPKAKKKPAKKRAGARRRAGAKASPRVTIASQLASATATGGAGHDFEIDVQTTFAVLMLADGIVPCLHNCKLDRIKVQGRYKGFNTDDMIAFAKNRVSGVSAKLHAQIKRTIDITASDPEFAKVIKAAWDDFNSPENFDRQTDEFALIASLISQADIRDTRIILEWARHSEDDQDFIDKVNKGKFSSNSKMKKLEVFRQQLAAANEGKPVSDVQLWEFMKHFHILGYDLDIRSGVTLSLVRSLIAQYPCDDVEGLRLKVADEVRAANHNAGVITLENIQDDIRKAFTRREERVMPAALRPVSSPMPMTSASSTTALNEAVVAQLLGSWNESRPDDIAIVEELAGTDYETFIQPLRDSLHGPNPAMRLRDGIWEVTDRLAVWDALGPRVFDKQLEALHNVAIKVLSERDPRFELDPEKRSAAQIYGKELKYSRALRRGLAVSLALLLNRNTVITSASHNHADLVPRRVARAVLETTDWVLWASLKDLLATLAEAAPEQFLDAVEDALAADPCPFDELFAQESGGIMGNSYISGLLWALETLAWDSRYLKQVTVHLTELAERDPGGKFSNRPANSLADMFLPWHPQTTAPFPEQLDAVRAMVAEDADTAWKVLIDLLPNVQTSTSGTRKPEWRPLDANATDGLTNLEYFNRVTEFSRIAVELAKADTKRLAELIKHLDSLPRPVFEELLAYLGSDPVRQLPQDQRQFIVDHLLNLAAHHSRFSDAGWAMPEDVVKRIRELADGLKAEDDALRFRRLFSNQDFELIDYEGDYNAQMKELEDARKKAMGEILQGRGFAGAMDFSRSVPSPWQAGLALGYQGTPEFDAQILPSMLSVEADNTLVSGYVVGRLSTASWIWVDGLPMTGWTPAEKGKFFAILPFIPDTWDRVESALGADEAQYWDQAFVNPYSAKTDLPRAISKLTTFKRPRAALSCVYILKHDKQPFDANTLADLLLAAAESSEKLGAGDAYQIVELIKGLQDEASVEQTKLFRIEWLYLYLLERHQRASPKTLERVMATDPAAFLEILGYVWVPEGATGKEPTEDERQRATRAYQLVRQWQVAPGTRPDGTLDPDAFTAWLRDARQQAAKLGLLDVALSRIGYVLWHAPADPSGLWIHETVARALDKKDAKKIRDGFRLGAINARGVHWVDPEGKPELALANEFDQKAKAVEAIGCARLGATLKSIADGYRRESAEIRRQHKAETTEA